MIKTVYILGAGFSANAGLPTMANFLDVAKSIFYFLLTFPAGCTTGTNRGSDNIHLSPLKKRSSL